MARSKPSTDGSMWLQLNTDDASGQGSMIAAEEVADRVQSLIIDGTLEEGARIPSERDLAGYLNISRPTVSQAIRVLVVRGLVESRRGSGAYVTRRPEASLAATVNLMLNLNQESVAHLNDLRLWLETVGVMRAIQVGSEEEFDEGAVALERLSADAGNIAAWMSADTLFHASLVRASHNPYLASIFESVHATLIDYEYRDWVKQGVVPSWLAADKLDDLVAIHEPILAAVRARDEDAARAAVLAHHSAMARHLIESGQD